MSGRVVASVALLLVFGSLAAPEAAAQSDVGAHPSAGAATTETQVLLTLMPQLAHPSARATIVRPVGPGAPDIILVTAETTPADLNQAIRMLMDARHTFGPSVAREMQAHVPAAEVTPLDLAMETGYLADLQTATEIEIPGIGPQRSLFMALEEQH